MKKVILFSGLLLAGGIFSGAGRSQPSDDVKRLMKEKLTCSQAILEGLAVNDFGKISRNAERLVQLTRTEEWFVLKTPRYEMHTMEFRKAANNIASKARDKNLDGIALAYFEMTMSCIRCHRYVREIREVNLSNPGKITAESQ